MSPSRRIAQRDEGLRRISRVTSATFGIGIIASAGFSVLAQQAFADSVRHRAVTAAAARVPLVRQFAETPALTEVTDPTSTVDSAGDQSTDTTLASSPRHRTTSSTSSWKPKKYRRLSPPTTTPRPRHRTVRTTPITQWQAPPPVTSGGS